jgi:hypothetical protein
MTADDVIAAVAPLWPYETLPGHVTLGEVVAKLAGLVAYDALSAETRAELCSGVLRIHWIKLSEGLLRRFQNQPERMRRKAALVDALTAVLELLSPTDNVIRVDAQLALAERPDAPVPQFRLFDEYMETTKRLLDGLARVEREPNWRFTSEQLETRYIVELFERLRIPLPRTFNSYGDDHPSLVLGARIVEIVSGVRIDAESFRQRLLRWDKLTKPVKVTATTKNREEL